MKSFLKWLVIVIGVLAGLFVFLPVFLPSHAHVEREIVIERSPEEVFAVVSDFRQSREWDPWVEQDPAVQSQVTGSGVGSVYTWSGESAGEGESRMVALDPPRSVDLKLKMVRPMQEEFESGWRLEPVANGTRAVWTFDQDLDWFQRYTWFCLDAILGPQFEKGLANLKRYVEK